MTGAERQAELSGNSRERKEDLPMETQPSTLWELWVDPVRRIVSFQPEAGSQYLAFRSRELFLSLRGPLYQPAVPLPIEK